MAKKEVKSKKEMRVKDPDKYDYAYLLHTELSAEDYLRTSGDLCRNAY